MACDLSASTSTTKSSEAWAQPLVALAAFSMAFVGALPYAGSWNDASRLATVEALVDYGTFAIDDSIFIVEYPPGHPLSLETDRPAMTSKTLDKLFIDGHFYSDKPPVHSVLLAGVYELIQAMTGLTAREHPRAFCYWMALFGAGIPYVVSVLAAFRIARTAGLTSPMCAAMALSFGFSTVALVYSRQVNGHIALLGATSWMCWALFEIGRIRDSGRTPPIGLYLLAGMTGGLGYTFDLGTGPVLLAGAGLLVMARRPGLGRLATFVFAAAPFLFVHHLLNYQIGGSFGPANANPAYFDYPGSPFGADNITGKWNHDDLADFLGYSADLLFGRHGFLTYNLPAMVAAFGGFILLLARRPTHLPEILFAYGVSAATWLMYSILSSNFGGQCCSIRWFVPLLAPAYMVLSLYYRRLPTFRWTFWLFSLWGGVMAWVMWSLGPWYPRMVPGFWWFMGGAVLSWLIGIGLWRRRCAIRRQATEIESHERIDGR